QAAVPPIARIDEEAFGIARVYGGGRAHDAKRVVGEKLLGVLEAGDMHEEIGQIVRRRDPAAVRIHPRDVHAVRIAANLAVIFDLAGYPVLQGVSGNPHVDDAATLEDAVLDILLVALTGQLLDD